MKVINDLMARKCYFLMFPPSNFKMKNIRCSLPLHTAGVLLLSTLITLVFWILLPAGLRQNDSSDYPAYYEPVARNILGGRGFVVPNGSLAVTYPPGYPILLAGVFAMARMSGLPESLVYSVFTLFCMGLSSVFVFLLSEKIWGLRGGWISALFFTTYPFVLYLTKQPNSEVPFMTAFYASLYVFWNGVRERKNIGLRLFIAGILIGAAMLIRAIAIGAGILLVGLFLVLRKDIHLKPRFFLALTLLLGNVLTVLPWQVWVYQQSGQITLLAANGAMSIKDGLTFAVESKNYRQLIAVPADVANLQREFVAESVSMNSFEKIFAVLVKHFVKEPFAMIKLYLIKAGRSWYGTDSGRMETASLVIQIFYGIPVLLSTLAVWRTQNPCTAGLLLFAWSLITYFWIMTILVLSILRYTTPAMGLPALLIPALTNIALYRRQFSPSVVH